MSKPDAVYYNVGFSFQLLDHNKGESELGRSKIKMTFCRFLNRWKKLKVLKFRGSLRNKVLHRPITSIKEPDFKNALTICWNGRDGRCH